MEQINLYKKRSILAVLVSLTANFLFSVNATGSKWIVVTTINYPTKALQQFVAQSDWRVVVVADKKTPADWNLPNCEFLSVEKQQNLGYQILPYLPWNHYCRKNIGYLYAIQHGATVIYDTDDDNILIKNKIEYYPEQSEMLVCKTKDRSYAEDERKS